MLSTKDEIICNSFLLLLIHLKTLRIVWGLDEAVREEKKQNPARQNKKVLQRSLRPFACAPQSHAGRWLSSRKPLMVGLAEELTTG